jgi:carbamoyl-phosphate synthase small subunit
VDIDTLPGNVEITHVSLNDGSLEGMALRDRPVFSIQFHPEASPGPHDAHGVFASFFKLVADCRF